MYVTVAILPQVSSPTLTSDGKNGDNMAPPFAVPNDNVPVIMVLRRCFRAQLVIKRILKFHIDAEYFHDLQAAVVAAVARNQEIYLMRNATLPPPDPVAVPAGARILFRSMGGQWRLRFGGGPANDPIVDNFLLWYDKNSRNSEAQMTINNIDFEAPLTRPPYQDPRHARPCGLRLAALYNNESVVQPWFHSRGENVLDGTRMSDYIKLESVNFVNFRGDIADEAEFAF